MRKKDYSFSLFLIILICFVGWISSIYLFERSHQCILRRIENLSMRISSLEERLNELPPLREKKEIEPSKKIEEIPPSKEIPPIKPSMPQGTSCKIAIILDDGGYGFSDDALSLIKMGFSLTISIIPSLPYSKETAEIVYKNKGEVMLHLPMEAEGNRKNKGVITSSMDCEKIKELTREAISSIPHCVGVNNHEGSKATAEEEVMEPVLEVIKEGGLYFVDSITTPKSIAYKLARKMDIPSTKRDIFIDNNNNPSHVLSYFYELIKLARKNGYAIGIGHIYKKATISILLDQLPHLKENGIELVPVSAIVKP